MPTLAILAGLPGSGKSTAARRLKADRGFFVVSTDGLRLALNAGVYPREAGGEYAALEPVVLEVARLAVRRLLEAGRDVAVDATHLTRDRRAGWREFARGLMPEVRVEIHWCVGRWDSAARWGSERGHTPAEYEAIRRELEGTVEEPRPDEADVVVVHGPAPAERPHD
jgi:predicted kinase